MMGTLPRSRRMSTSSERRTKDMYVKTTEALKDYVGVQYRKPMRQLVQGTGTREPTPRKAAIKDQDISFE
jgi:hypothetical protein